MSSENSKRTFFVFEKISDIQTFLETRSEIQRLSKENHKDHTLEYNKYLKKYLTKLDNGLKLENVKLEGEVLKKNSKRKYNDVTKPYAIFVDKEWTSKFNTMYSDIDKIFHKINNSKDTETTNKVLEKVRELIVTYFPYIGNKLKEVGHELITRLKGLDQVENQKLTLILMFYTNVFITEMQEILSKNN